MNRNMNQAVTAKRLAYSLGRAGGWSKNPELYWLAVNAFSGMAVQRARGWVELWAARAQGCPVALATQGPRRGTGKHFTV